ncbi:MAG: copper amine oxidase N-terminal domain-containing protein, partial [Peptococcaceae bacterium]|nr:copper amine oxidase N-terminal domain-containing protein [Peptococcaceae bacterium]
NRTFVPFRALAEAFGATVAYDEATQAVTAELNGVTVVMTIGAAEYTVNGVAKTADVAPFIAGSRTMVPVRFVAEAFGINVTPTYDDNGATADILFAK